MKDNHMTLKSLGGLLLLASWLQASAQVQNVVLHKSDGSTMKFDVTQVDSISFQSLPKWNNRSKEAVNLLTYMEENTGKKMLSGVHACVNYNTNEADWVYKHTGKYPAINCIDYIHDIYSSTNGWVDYSNYTIWRNWNSRRGVLSAMWHWNMLANDGRGYTCTPGTEAEQTGFHPACVFNKGSDEYNMLIARIDQVAKWLKPMSSSHMPVLWRPLHEAQGNWSEEYPGTDWHKAWFWWGIDGPEAFVELWRVMYDRMVNYHKLTNLIWVFNAGDSKRWYPGDEYVDIVAYDFYNKDLDEMHRWYDLFHELYPGKLYAISEFGNIPKMSEIWADGQYWNYMAPWWDNKRTANPSSAEFNSTDHQNASIDYWQDALQCDFIITRDELPSFR